MEDIDRQISLAVDAISKADALIIAAGAGMGVDSGLPDFRGNEGFWNAYPPIRELGISFMEMANPRWFNENPQLAWGFYGHRLNLYRNTLPHEGFEMLLNCGAKMNEGYFVYTSNVDGHFQKAGFDAVRIKECHGSIHHLQCTTPCSKQIWEAADVVVNVDETTFLASEPLPCCPNCGSIARPNILMFGDWYWLSERTTKQSEGLQKFLDLQLHPDTRLVVVELGAGSSVPTVRMRSETFARRKNATLIRINPREYQVPAGHISVPLGALDGLRKIFS